MKNLPIPQRVEGYFKKRKNGSKVKIFTKYTKRFFVLDVQSGCIQYSADKGKKDVEKVYNVDIHETYTAQAILQNKEDPFKDKCPKGWEHAIVLETKERKYNLFAKDYNFKCRFMFVLEECMKEKEQFMQSKLIQQQNKDNTKQENVQVKTEESLQTKKKIEGVRNRAESVNIRQIRKDLFEEDKNEFQQQRPSLKQVKEKKAQNPIIQEFCNEVPVKQEVFVKEKSEANLYNYKQINRQSTSEQTQSLIEDSMTQNPPICGSHPDIHQSIISIQRETLIGKNQQFLLKNECNNKILQDSQLTDANEFLEESFLINNKQDKKLITSDRIKKERIQPRRTKNSTQREQKEYDNENKIQQKTDFYGNISLSKTQVRKSKKQLAGRLAMDIINYDMEGSQESLPKSQQLSPQKMGDIIQKEFPTQSEIEVSSALLREKKKLSNQIRKKYRKRSSINNIADSSSIVDSQQSQMPMQQLENIIDQQDISQIQNSEPVKLESQFRKDRRIAKRDSNNDQQIFASPLEIQPFIQLSQNESGQPLTKRPLKNSLPLSKRDIQSKSKSQKLLKKQKSIKEKIADVIDDRGSDLSDQSPNNQDGLDSPFRINEMTKTSQTANLNLGKVDFQTCAESEAFQNEANHSGAAQLNQNQNLLQKRGRAQSYSDLQNMFIPNSNIQQRISQQTTKQESQISGIKTFQMHGTNQTALSSKNFVYQEINNSQPNPKQKSIINSSQMHKSEFMITQPTQQYQPLEINGNDRLISMIKQNLNHISEVHQSSVLDFQTQKDQSPLSDDKNLFHADVNTRLQLLKKWENKFGNAASPIKAQQPNQLSEWDNMSEFQSHQIQNKNHEELHNLIQSSGIVNERRNRQGQQSQMFDFNNQQIIQPNQISCENQLKRLQMSSTKNLNSESINFSQKIEETQEVRSKSFQRRRHNKTKSQVQNGVILEKEKEQLTDYRKMSQIGKFLDKGGLGFSRKIIENNEHQSQNSYSDNQSGSNQNEDKPFNILDRIRMSNKVKVAGNVKQMYATSGPAQFQLDDQFSQLNSTQLNINNDTRQDMVSSDDLLKQPKTSKTPSSNNNEISQFMKNPCAPNLMKHCSNIDYCSSESYSLKKCSYSKAKIMILKPSQIIKAENIEPTKKIQKLDSPKPPTPKINSKPIIQHQNYQFKKDSQNSIRKSVKENDTFDYNWDDETINNNSNHQQKATLKSKLVMRSISNGAQLKNPKAQEGHNQYQDEYNPNNDTMNSVRKAVEDSAQISIWD